MFGFECVLFGAMACGSAVLAWYTWSTMRGIMIDFVIPWAQIHVSASVAQMMRELVIFIDNVASATIDVARRLADFAKRILCLDIIYRRLAGCRLQKTTVASVFDGTTVRREVTREIVSLDELSPEDRKLFEQLRGEKTYSLAPRIQEQAIAALKQRLDMLNV